MKTARLLVLSLATTVGGAFAAPPARAWDPSTTHAGMVTRALIDSAMHLRWMEASELSRGLFTSLRIDPLRLDDDLRRRIEMSQRRAHADSGAQGLGGPGACPGVTAPISTRTRCVDGDDWEATALGWISLGIVAETSPRERLLHHFSDRTAADASQWSTEGVSKRRLRTAQRHGDGPGFATVTGTALSGKTQSAAGWLDDPDDPWAPPAMFEHLRKASMLQDSDARQHHMALALIGLGALLHVVQDASVPAHARGDLAAFLAPLSRAPGDRGLPLAEYARVLHGRAALPTRLTLDPRDAQARRGVVLATSLLAHLAGTGTGTGTGATSYEGIAVTAATRFLSDGSLPAPLGLDPSLSATDAAAVLLADAGMAPSVLSGARLSAWPADAGYLLSGTGRPLAAFTSDRQHEVTLYLDRRVYRDQIGQLIPMAVDASRSVVDLVFPAWPTTTHSPGGDVLEVDTSEFPGVDPALSVLIEDAAGHRRLHRTVTLPTRSRLRIVGAIPTIAEGERIVLVLRATIGRHQLTTESLLERPAAVRDDEGDAVPGALAPTVRGTATEASADAEKSETPPTDGTVQPVGQSAPTGEATDNSSAKGAPNDGSSDADAEPTPATKVPGQVPDGQVPGGPSGSDSPEATPPSNSPGLVATPKTEQP